MNDFNDSLWGEDDIDEALLIEASQQVEAETVSKVDVHVINCYQGRKQIEAWSYHN